MVATLKFVDLVRDIIAKASVFEEEDFQPLHYGFQVKFSKACEHREHRSIFLTFYVSNFKSLLKFFIRSRLLKCSRDYYKIIYPFSAC